MCLGVGKGGSGFNLSRNTFDDFEIDLPLMQQRACAVTASALIGMKLPEGERADGPGG